jgi:tetratricopeptide (TPR) repeat protein
MLLRFLRRLAIVTSVVGAVFLNPVYAQSSGQNQRKPLPSDPLPRTQSESQTDKDQAPSKTSPENDDGVSSSRDQIIDLSPPKNDAKDHPDSEVPFDDATGVQEFHQFDPHKAAKAVEIGDFYFKRKNYAAAVSRYREALLFKPNDAIATFRLAQALEQSRNFAEARKEYESYLKILPHGPSAAEARKALGRLPKTLSSSASS